MLNRVKDILAEIHKLEAELSCIRENCPHKEYKVVMYSWRVAAYLPSRVCLDCGSTIPGITAEEESMCWSDWNQRTALILGGEGGGSKER